MFGTPPGPAGSKTVLYIDDNADDACLFLKACAALDASFKLKLASGGQEAIAYLDGRGEYADRSAHPVPDFILLDIKMPNMDGFEVLKWIRSHPKASGILVALYSSSIVDRDVLRGYLTGTTFFIPKQQKGAKLRGLIEALDACLRSGGEDCERLIKLSIPPAKV